MKKFFISLIVFSVVASLFFVSSKSQSTSGDATEKMKTIEVTSYVKSTKNGVIKENMGSLNMVTPIKTDEEKIKDTRTVVIHGTVTATEYVLDGSTVYTKSEVEVLDCYKGDFSGGDKVYVREIGGFIRADVYNNAICMEKYGVGYNGEKNGELLDVRVNDFKVMEKDEEVILFLVPIESTTLKAFENGCYDLLRVWQGKLLYNDETELFVPYVPAEELASISVLSEKENTTYQVESAKSETGTIEASVYSLDEFERFVSSVKMS